MSRFQRAYLCIVLWASSGCFTDSSLNAGTASGTTGTQCAVGAQACPCYPNSTCNDALVCMDELCFPTDCQLGAEDCPCAQGACDGELVCRDGACRRPATGSGTSTTNAVTTDPTAMSTTTFGSTGVGETDPVPGECLPGDGLACTECAKAECCRLWSTCAAGDVCGTILACLDGETPVGECTAPFIDDLGVYPLLDECFGESACVDICASATWKCLALPLISPCTECAAQECCEALATCQANPQCECYEACRAGRPGEPPREHLACLSACAAQQSNSVLINNLIDCAGDCVGPIGDPCY